MDFLVELTLISLIIIFVWGYRSSRNSEGGESVTKFLFNGFQNIYNRYAPYSYQEVQNKAKELGYDYSTREYVGQIVLFGGGATAIAYLYFYNIPLALLYGFVATMGVPYIKYLKTNILYS